MKPTIDNPDQVLADAMRFTGAKTKREAVGRRSTHPTASNFPRKWWRVAALNFATTDEIEADDMAEITRREQEALSKPSK